ncbi:DNA-protecting protein DprA [Pseudoxanthomonas broegbernensis]|uniref:DNA-protecting protein DprA n=1 Tax=Pseudoxanthomonas broegbernensis TaxID=83619 RepID=A0A7V8GKM3_9GAMM|nr:DNA-processing protein DprA [Pseudoxanthomonas broegbernensis]KAF1685233.1 DNA-protecting protein DprA [Pseudoxanthomonas broegbernensis]MBB6066119.1 DNA processing protein [Pseudoxanthomonas broegbernensis]
MPPASAPVDPLPLLRLLLAGGPTEPRRVWLQRPAGVEPGPGAPDPLLAARMARVPARELDRCLAWLARPRHHVVGWNDPRYPPLLRQLPQPPPGLFVAGDPEHLWRPALAVVGSRGASAGGRDNARHFARRFCRAGLAVTSGLAAGIDAAAHAAALECGGTTVAVLGTGPDRAYPQAHARLLEQVAEHGAAVSEHPPGTPPRPGHFPGRNRIIAGLSLGTVVIEAALRSGALITARLAAEAGREVFALPGSIHQPLARGCHRLIRDGAQLVEAPDEVLSGIASLAGRLAAELSASAPPSAESESGAGAADQVRTGHYRLWRALGHDPIPMDVLVERTGLTPAALSSMLLGMELDGRVAVEHGRYARRSTGGGTVA